jgi:hypothetical protein
MGREWTRIDLSGQYKVPLGLIGRAVNDGFLHGLAEETLRAFLHRLARTLETDNGISAVG